MPEPLEEEPAKEQEVDAAEEVHETVEVVPEDPGLSDLENRASPTARPHSRGSVSPSRKVCFSLLLSIVEITVCDFSDKSFLVCRTMIGFLRLGLEAYLKTCFGELRF